MLCAIHLPYAYRYHLPEIPKEAVEEVAPEMSCVYTNADAIPIRSGRGNILLIALNYMLLLSFGYYLIADSDGIVSIACMGWGVLVIGTVFCASWCVAVLRKLDLTREGVYLSFLMWKWYYCWQDISIYYESRKDRLGLRDQYDGVVILALKSRHRKPEFIDPMMYCILFHPWSFIFIHFLEDSLYPDSAGIYSIDKKEFVSKMASWNLIGTGFADDKVLMKNCRFTRVCAKIMM